VKGKRKINSIDSSPLLLNYSGNQPLILSSWDEAHHTLSIFKIDETFEINVINNLLLVENSKNFCALVGEKILNNYIKFGLVNQPKTKKPLFFMFTTAINSNIPIILSLNKMTRLNEKKAPKPTVTKKSYT